MVSHYDDPRYWRPASDLFLHVQAGRKDSQFKLDMRGDDSGDNISGKNERFGELTVLYWAWKNLTAPEVIGFCHYRRYFLLDARYQDHLYPVSESMRSMEKTVTGTSFLSRCLEQADVLVARPREFQNANIESQYKQQHAADDFDAMVEAVLRWFPEYAQSRLAFVNSRRLYCCNMFIARRVFFERYMNWLFSILSDLESCITAQRQGYQRRTFAFLGERLLNWHLIHLRMTEQLKIRELGVAFLDQASYRRTLLRY